MTDAGISVDAAQLERVFQHVDPSVRLVTARLLRRIIRRHFGLASGQRPPHDLCFDAARVELLAIASPAELGGSESLPDRVVLLPLPDDDEPSTVEVLVDLWRRLFHARIDRVIEQKGAVLFNRDAESSERSACGALRSEDSASRLNKPEAPAKEKRSPFGATLLHEIRTVMEGENRLPPPADDSTLYREFAAFLLELNYFFPDQIESYFPGLLHSHEVIRRLDESLGAQAIFESTRPPGIAPAAAVHAEDAGRPRRPSRFSTTLVWCREPCTLPKTATMSGRRSCIASSITSRKPKRACGIWSNA